MSLNIKKVSPLGLLVALGIIFGDIGTSPLYVFNAIIGSKIVSEQLIIGSLSCIIWTLTLQTTIKYVILTLKADNRGEGGIFSLYALVRRRKRWLVIPAMIGGAALLADGMITPPISITSAIEGLRQIPRFSDISQQTIVLMVLGIITVIFFLQQFGTASIGKLFGPIMLIWFLMLATMGLLHFLDDWNIFKALNPYYAIDLLVNYPQGFWILGAVFLCTTGAEALYSDLGHCGRGNIRVSWIFVKSCLIINYVGQGAWLLANYEGKGFDVSQIECFLWHHARRFPDHWNCDCNSSCYYCQPGIDLRVIYTYQRSNAIKSLAKIQDPLSIRRKRPIVYSCNKFFIVCRMRFSCIIFSAFIKYGRCLWSCHHTLHDRNIYPLCQLSCFTKS